jgi:hypothetical protein
MLIISNQSLDKFGSNVLLVNAAHHDEQQYRELTGAGVADGLTFPEMALP